MSGDSALSRLALAMGIEPEFSDARGRIVRATADTKRHLLSAMGLNIRTESDARVALHEIELREWLRPLPPVRVSQANAPIHVDVVLPSSTKVVAWLISFESGSQRGGRHLFKELDLLGQKLVEKDWLERRRLELPGDLPCGYHSLQVQKSEVMSLIVSPGQCWLPERRERLWGIAAQLYLLRSRKNWGIGDFTDLRTLVEIAGARGADVIGLNPLHANFLDQPDQASPYSPASRLLLNVLNIDVTAVPDLKHSPAAQALLDSAEIKHQIKEAREQSLVDYRRVAELKFKALQCIFEESRHREDQPRWKSFLQFRSRGGELLEKNCLFFALRTHFSARGKPDWHDWPPDFRTPSSSAVVRFSKNHEASVDFLSWLQWLADEQLAAAAKSAQQQGMAVGLYRDLAVGADRAGAETWINASAVVSRAEVGAPPDIYNPAGQTWGIPPFHPGALREEAYRSFIELVRANMRHAGGLRIDHVMGLQHLYWVPEGQKPSNGAFVHYPRDDLIGILALESHRHRCLVVGEDLGTVPRGFRERITDANILSYRVLFFEHDANGAFLAPETYPTLALSVLGSHDLPTLRAWWSGDDLKLKKQLNLFPESGELERQSGERAHSRKQLLMALRDAHLIQGEISDFDLLRAAHGFIARTSSMVAMAQLDDLTEEIAPVNVPGTSDQHPNWRRKYSVSLEELSSSRTFLTVVQAFARERAKNRSALAR
jgi:4-alpha-glucanotransferase